MTEYIEWLCEPGVKGSRGYVCQLNEFMHRKMHTHRGGHFNCSIHSHIPCFSLCITFVSGPLSVSGDCQQQDNEATDVAGDARSRTQW